MNRRSWLTSLLAFPLVPLGLRVEKAQPAEPPVCKLCLARGLSFKSNSFEVIESGWTEVRSDGTGVEFIVHDAKQSKDCSWSCHDGQGGHVSFIAPADIGPAEIEARKRLAMEAKKS